MTNAQNIIAKLKSAVANAAPVAGVEWQIDERRDAIVLNAIYADTYEYTDEPWVALGEVPAFDRSMIDNDGHGTIFNFIQYDLEDEDA